MAEYDWLTSGEFRTAVENQLKETASRAGMQTYQPAIVEAIFARVRENSPLLESREMSKQASERRTMGDAMRSVAAVINEASGIAKTANRTLLTAEDFEAAYQRKFCQIWPIYRG
jgi:hypothetical protein